MTDKQIKNLILTGEGYNTEFKQSLDKSFIEEACAFANASGGYILIGISDDGKVTGVDTSNRSRSKIQDILNRLEPKLKISKKLVINLDKKLIETTREAKAQDDKVQDIFSVNDNKFRSIFGVTANEFRSIFGVNILNTAWLIYKNPNITAQKIAEKLSITKRSAENYFSKLKTAKYIKRIGSDKKGHWKILMKRGTNKGVKK